MYKSLFILSTFLCFLISGRINSQPHNQLDTKLYHEIRSGLNNCYIRFTIDKIGRVAFMGGSITQNSGWRDSVCNYLTKRFPETKFEFINAGIGSTGSIPGAFRIGTDVLSKGRIDLFFEEAAVNDRGNRFDYRASIRAMEGIVYRTRKTNPCTDIVIMYFVDPGKIADYNKGLIPMEIQAHEEVAKHYNIPAIHLAKEVTDRLNNREFDWEKDFVDLHPSPFGQGIYYNSVKAFLESCWKLAEESNNKKVVQHGLPPLLDKFSYTSGKYVNIKSVNPKTKWKFLQNWSSSNSLVKHKMTKNVPILYSEKPGETVEFEFKGSAVGICCVTGPDVGVIEYTIDGKYSGVIDLFTLWSTRYNIPWYVVFEDELGKGKHRLNLKISKEKSKESEGYACRILYFLVNK
jgi:lysophospholipase L1-like esterase